MLGILLIFVLTAVSLALVFWVGGMFLQGYFYTSPSPHMFWQVPATGVAVAAFITMWCLVIAMSADATPTNIPYDTIFRFSPEVEMVNEPVKELWVVQKKGKKKEGKQVRYVREHIYDRYAPARYIYHDDSVAKKRWDPNIEAILLDYNNEKLRFEPIPAGEGGYRRFVADKGGWEMTEYEDGPSGRPSAFRLGRFLVNILLNVLLWTLLFVAFWLLMQFRSGHAFVLATGFWLMFTLILLPMLFSYAADMAYRRRPAPTAPPAQTAAPIPFPIVA